MHSVLMDDLLLGQSGIAGYPPGATFGPRLLYDFEFIWIIEGSAKVDWTNTGLKPHPVQCCWADPA